MPPLLCLSPVLLDQSFPRDEEELQRVAIALGEIQGCIENDEAHLVVTEPLEEVVEVFEWDHPQLCSMYSLLQIIRDLLNQWFLQRHERLVKLKVPEDLDFQSHPVPKGSENQGLVEDWSVEVGKVFALHSECSKSREFFIGVACDCAFAGEELGEYDNPGSNPTFPLIGPEDVNSLADAYEWSVPDGIRRRAVCFDDAYRNCFLLGATSIGPPSGGSHYKVKFPECDRPWPLDRNVDPLPLRFLKQLVPLAGYPLEVIIYALVNGVLPEYRLRLWRHQVS